MIAFVRWNMVLNFRWFLCSSLRVIHIKPCWFQRLPEVSKFSSTCEYHGVRNVSFSDNIAYVLKKLYLRLGKKNWPEISDKIDKILLRHIERFSVRDIITDFFHTECYDRRDF